MNRLFIGILALFAATLTTGCHSYESRSYDVSVHNASVESVTLWLTKDGDPYENGWMSPEEMAMSSPKNEDYIVSGVIAPPGKTASTGLKSGRFDTDTEAILRIYDGQLKFNDVLAVGPGSALRIDLALPPGASSWQITRNNKGLIEVRPQVITTQPATAP